MTEAADIPLKNDKKTKISKGIRGIIEGTKEFQRISKIHNGLVPQSIVGTVLGVSRQRVHQLISEGTFSTWEFYGMKWLSQDEVVEFGKLQRKAGENQHKPSLKQLWKDSREAGNTFAKNHKDSGS